MKMLLEKTVMRYRRLLIATVVAAAAAISLVAPAGASAGGIITYCAQCTIGHGATVNSYPTWANAYLNYVHRLSGPGSSPIISWTTYINTPYQTICSSGVVYTTEATCNPGRIPVIGSATNGGAGNYGFNAHMDY